MARNNAEFASMDKISSTSVIYRHVGAVTKLYIVRVEGSGEKAIGGLWPFLSKKRANEK